MDGGERARQVIVGEGVRREHIAQSSHTPQESEGKATHGLNGGLNGGGNGGGDRRSEGGAGRPSKSRSGGGGGGGRGGGDSDGGDEGDADELLGQPHTHDTMSPPPTASGWSPLKKLVQRATAVRVATSSAWWVKRKRKNAVVLPHGKYYHSSSGGSSSSSGLPPGGAFVQPVAEALGARTAATLRAENVGRKRDKKNSLERSHTFTSFDGGFGSGSAEGSQLHTPSFLSWLNYTYYTFVNSNGVARGATFAWQRICLTTAIVLAVLFMGLLLPSLLYWSVTAYGYEQLYDLETHEWVERGVLVSSSGGEWSSWDLYLEYMWLTWTTLVEPGTHMTEVVLGRRILSAVITIAGIMSLAGITAKVVDRVAEHRVWVEEVGPRVVERGHFLIIGWTEKTINVVVQLAEASCCEGGTTIVILSDTSKKHMEHALLSQLGAKDLKGTRVICRRGSAMLPASLLMCSISTAKAVIVLAQTDGDADKADAHVLRMVLSMRAMSSVMEGHIVSEIRDIDNEALFKVVGGDKVETVVSHDILGQMMVHCARCE